MEIKLKKKGDWYHFKAQSGVKYFIPMRSPKEGEIMDVTPRDVIKEYQKRYEEDLDIKSPNNLTRIEISSSEEGKSPELIYSKYKYNLKSDTLLRKQKQHKGWVKDFRHRVIENMIEHIKIENRNINIKNLLKNDD